MDDFIAMCKSLGSFIAAIILSIMFCKQYLNKALNIKKNIIKQIPIQNQKDIEILKELDHVKEACNADRIQVYEFQDGDTYGTGRHALKMTCTYEVVKAGSKALIDSCQKLPIICMPEFIKKIVNEKEFECLDLEDLKHTMPATYNFKSNLGIRAFYDIALRNKEGYAIGFIAIHWDNKDNVYINQELINRLIWFLETRLNVDKNI